MRAVGLVEACKTLPSGSAPTLTQGGSMAAASIAVHAFVALRQRHDAHVVSALCAKERRARTRWLERR
jgi:hypothetical protein